MSERDPARWAKVHQDADLRLPFAVTDQAEPSPYRDMVWLFVGAGLGVASVMALALR